MLSFDKLTGNGRDIYNYLSESDSLTYFSEQDRVHGQWYGKGASALGLSGEVDRDSFNQIKDCNHPQTGEFLRQRESKIKMFDLCASAPKSFSIMARPGGDTRLDDAHKKAVFEMLGDVERHMGCEVQANGLNGTRKTGSLIAAVFLHDTSRMKDPLLHGHAAVANMTYDEAEERWKALDARVLYERKSYFLQVYRNALARECMGLGYDIEMHSCGKNGRDKSFEIVGVPREMQEKFSKMSGLIAEGVEQFIESKGKAPTEDQVGHIAHQVRPGKQNLPAEEVAAYQQSQLSQEERATLANILERARANDGRAVESWSAEASVRHAMDQVFSRRSVAKDFELAREALIHGRGHVTPQAIEESLKDLRAEGVTLQHRNNVATEATLNREKQMCWLVDQGVGQFDRLDRGNAFEHAKTPEGSYRLNEQQREAVDFIRSSQSFVVNLSGAPGVGKTTALQEIYRTLEEAGRKVIAVAPTRGAKEKLEAVGISEDRTMTVQKLIQDRNVLERLRDSTVILDEAGLVDNKSMFDLLRFGHQSNARFIMSGDSLQNGPVEAGDALRTLEKESALRSKDHTFELTEIERQKGNPEYKAAIEAMRHDPQKGFDMLVEMGAVREVDANQRTAAIAEEFKAKPGALVIASTHAENDRINEAVKASGETRTLKRMQSLGWSEAERRDVRRYETGQYLLFHKATNDGRLDTAYRVTGNDDRFVHTVDLENNKVSFSKKQAAAFGVFRQDEVEVSVGDRLAFQTNASRGRFECINGGEAEITGFDAKGRPVLNNGQAIPTTFYQFNLAYAQTPQKAQGQTVNSVIVSADYMEREKFYVSASRGRDNVTVFTSDIEELRNSIAISDARPTALEMERQCAEVSALDRWCLSMREEEEHRQIKIRHIAGESYRHIAESERTSGYTPLNTTSSQTTTTASFGHSAQSAQSSSGESQSASSDAAGGFGI